MTFSDMEGPKCEILGPDTPQQISAKSHLPSPSTIRGPRPVGVVSARRLFTNSIAPSLALPVVDLPAFDIAEPSWNRAKDRATRSLTDIQGTTGWHLHDDRNTPSSLVPAAKDLVLSNDRNWSYSIACPSSVSPTFTFVFYR
jgi:hypothetical protein